MRFSRFFLTATVAGLAAWTAAAAQENSSAQPEAKSERPAAEAEAAPQPAPATPPPAAAAPARPAQPQPLTRAQMAELDQAVQRGRLLIAIARAGLISTHDMLSRVPDPAAAGIAGWIAEPQGNSVAVTYYAQGDDGPVAVYRGTVLGGRVTAREVFLTGTRPPLSPLQARMAAAREATDAGEQRPCTDQPFNVFVVPPAAAGAPIDVYRFTAPNQRGRFPLGGHFRSTVEADGTVSGARGFTNACIDLQVEDVPAGQQPRPIAVVHLLDPLPTEIHVFMALWTGRPLVVAADDPQRLWLVTGDRIAEIR